MPRRLHPDVEREVRRLAAKGHKLREIGRMLSCSRHAVTNALQRDPLPVAPAVWSPAPGRLSLDEREEIQVGLERGDTFRRQGIRAPKGKRHVCIQAAGRGRSGR